METIYSIFFFIFGTIMGSFYNVVGCRLPNGESLIKPPSHCPKCKKRLGVMELIPIISYIIQGGKCKHCKKKIGLFYPVFEFLTGVLFVISYLTFGLTSELIVALTFSSALLIIIISDIKYMIIPDEVIIVSTIMLFTERLLMGYEITLLFMNAVIPFVLMFLIKLLGDLMFKKESLGGGDIKLMIVFGLAIGWQNVILVIALAAFLALPISLIILFRKKTNIIAFGPYLSAAALIIYFLSINYTHVLDLLVK